jgi:large subunit ribosomal protein L21
MKYAVIKTGGKQYKVSEGDVLEVERLKAEKDSKISFDNVLLLVSDSSVKIGKPFLAGEKVEAKLLENIKGEKIRVSKYKSKVRFRRTTGFRASISKVLIEKIGGKEVKEVKVVEKKLPKKTVKK